MGALQFHRAFEHVDDPRAFNASYPLTDVILMAVIAVLCGAQDWAEVCTYCQLKADFLRTALKKWRGVPSPDTFERVFSLIDPAQVDDAMRRWTRAQPSTKRAGRQLAVDGKAHRGARSDASRRDLFSSVSVYCSDSGLFLASLGYGPGHEKAAALEVLEEVELSGALVSVDALHTGEALARSLHERGADWLMPIKGDHPARRAEIAALFASPEALKGELISSAQSCELNRGRVETRTVRVARVGLWFGERGPWPGMRSVVEIERERVHKSSGESESEVIYFATSLAPEQADRIATAIRSHWSIENGGHWVLDVEFGEDASRARSGHQAANLGTVRRFCVNLLKTKRGGQDTLKARRVKALMDDDYLRLLLSLLHMR